MQLEDGAVSGMQGALRTIPKRSLSRSIPAAVAYSGSNASDTSIQAQTFWTRVIPGGRGERTGGFI